MFEVGLNPFETAIRSINLLLADKMNIDGFTTSPVKETFIFLKSTKEIKISTSL